ncbi:MAG: alpha/beta hydrolase [Candidatus Acidiferrales bacterium]
MPGLETWWGIIRAVLIGVLLSILLIRMFEERLIFFPDIAYGGGDKPEDYGLRAEEVFLTTSDGVRLHGYWSPAAAAERTILLFHGNAGNLSHRLDYVAFLNLLPANVLAIDYRGYGKSEGRPTEAGVYLDAEAAYDHVTRERGVRPEQLVAVGQSLGVAVAVDLATKRSVAALILEGGFPSARRVAQRAVWLPGIGYILRSRFDSASKLKELRIPVLVAHCRQDSVLPFSLGEELYAAANQPKTFVAYRGPCHEPLFHADPVDYAERLSGFLGIEATEAKEANETED